MSRAGGRGGMGRRGGRGGRRGGGPKLPWEEDPQLRVDGRPAEVFPPYEVPIPIPLTRREKSQVASFLLFREQVHDGPLYTAARSRPRLPGPTSAPLPRAYGREQANQRYTTSGGGRGRTVAVDPFTAVEMPSSRHSRPERLLPDLAARPFAPSLFPPELHAALDGKDAPGPDGSARTRKKTMRLSRVTMLRTAAEIFNVPWAGGAADAAVDGQKKALEALEQLGEGGGDDEMDIGFDEEGGYEDEIDEAYDDEDGGDYDAEGYFDNGDDDDMDDGGGDEGEY